MRDAPRIGLKVDVDTLRGTREGVPRLAKLLKKHGADATFYFSVGPDHTGRAVRRVFRPGFAKKVVRTSVLRHYGLKTLLYGVLLPGPDIGRVAGDVMRETRDAGFEVGLHTFDHIRWQDFVAGADDR
jgi:undecaprenyl phosphate-alpha-L-ara4FN deformylase